jgi:PPK2 family polyphosphate:nucleotide phosphotransferase
VRVGGEPAFDALTDRLRIALRAGGRRGAAAAGRSAKASSPTAEGIAVHLTPVVPGEAPVLDDAAATASALADEGDDELKRKVKKLGRRIAARQEALYAEGRHALLVVLQGRDASGKDGTLRRVFGPVNPQGLTTTSFKRPTDDELAHDYLWRVHRAIPPLGSIGIFNRSHYEDVLVVRVEGLVPESEWSQRYRQINEFERLLVENRVVVLKFLLHISREEQRRRLEERLEDPRKNWKFREGDLRARARWDDYTLAYQEALARCSTAHAPWYVVPADRNASRNFLVADTVASTLDALDPKFPAGDPGVLTYRGKIV